MKEARAAFTTHDLDDACCSASPMQAPRAPETGGGLMATGIAYERSTPGTASGAPRKNAVWSSANWRTASICHAADRRLGEWRLHRRAP